MSRLRRRTVGLVALAIGAAVVAIGAYEARINELAGQIGGTVGVLRLHRAVVAGATPGADDVESVEMPASWVPPGAFGALDELRGLVSAAALPVGTVLSVGLLVGPPELSSDERRSVVLFDRAALTDGAAPGAHVDVVASFDASVVGVARSEVVVRGARVVAVGDGAVEPATSHADAAPVADAAGAASIGVESRVPVAFAVDPGAALRLAFAESFASTLRLAVISPLARTTSVVPSYSAPHGTAP